MDKFQIEIVTPEKKFFNGEIESVNMKTLAGRVQILANHIPYVTGLVPGVVKILQDGKEKKAVLSGGFVEFSDNKTTILADAAEWPEDIDVNRAKEAQKRAQDRLSKKDNNLDVERAKLALARSLARLEASSK